MKKFLAAIIVGASLIFSGCGGEKSAEQMPVKSSDVKTYYENGQFKVGVDLAAGEYIAVGTGYVEVTSDGKTILINDNIVSARRYVTAHDGEYVKLQGDIKLYEASAAPRTDTSGTILSGQYKAGSDIKTGEYKITLEAGGYFEVTSDTRRAYVKNQFAQNGGSYYATVSDGQYLQIKNGVGEYVKAVESQPAAPQKILNLGMTFEQFKAAYNAKIKEYAPETNWDVSSSKLAAGREQDVFMWQFTERVALMGMVDKSNGLLKNLVVMSLPQDQNDYDAALLAYGLSIAVLSPELNYGQRSELLGELHIFDALYDTFTDLRQRNFEALRGNVKYQTGYIADKGAIHFWASAKDL